VKHLLSIILLFSFVLGCGTENKPTFKVTTTVSPTEGGTITLTPSGGVYSKDEIVELAGIPSDGWSFVRWEGDWVGTVSTVSIGINRSYSIVGVFEKNDDGKTVVVNVTNPITGRTWMDRNLGATRVATSSTDIQSYGDLYQWGRRSDGHEKRNSTIISTLSSMDAPDHGSFIRINGGNYDWRSPQNNNLWQGVNGINNPCPVGYRIPTKNEWDEEQQSWSTNNNIGAFNSILKLPTAGYRYVVDGSHTGVGQGAYWSTTLIGIDARILFFTSTLNSIAHNTSRGYALSVRCIKN